MADPNSLPPNQTGVTHSGANPDVTTGDASLTPTEPRPVGSLSERYELGDELARGGMGAVVCATDRVLQREVAIKVLLDRYPLGSAMARRFMVEARITSQLQHPGIPPVHDLGTLPDGRPFLAMKFIRGETLDALLKSATQTARDLGRFLASFEKVCEAVAYAHAHGVIHRDLKPANIMVGAFGEVQVMDWGLAKHLRNDPGGLPNDDPDQTNSYSEILDLHEAETQAGSVLGTPAYMPPEQAIGAIHEIDQRSDVFGLGGILAAILTGRPPFVGDSAETTRVLAAKGKVQDCFARLDQTGADPELVALAKLCLSPDKENRPADAGQVAQAVAGLRAAADERARQAEIGRAEALIREAELMQRRRIRRTAGVIVGLLLAMIAVGSTVAAWRLAVQRDIIAAREQVILDERDEVQRQKTLADDRLVANRQAIFTFVNDVPRILEGSPYPQTTREINLLSQEILTQVEGLSDEASQERGLLALVYREAWVAESEGRIAEAERLYQEALTQARTQDRPDTPRRGVAIMNVGSLMLELAKYHIRRSDGWPATEKESRSAQTLALLDEAITCCDRVRQTLEASGKRPDEIDQLQSDIERSRATVYRNLARSRPLGPQRLEAQLAARQHAVDGLRFCQQAHDRALAANLSPRTLTKRKDSLAQAYLDVAQDQSSEAPQTAAQSFQTSLDLIQAAQKAAPGVLRTSVHLQSIATSYGDFALMVLKDPKKAETLYQVAANSLNPIVNPAPLDNYRVTFSTDLYKLAYVNRQLGNEADAIRRWTLCAEVREPLVRAKQRVADRLKQPWHRDLVDARINLMLAQSRLGLREPVLDTANWIARSEPRDPNHLAMTAMGLSLCASRLPASDPNRAADMDRAFQFLTQALDAGFENRDYLDQDPDCEQLRADPRFVGLLSRMKPRTSESPSR